MRYASCFVAALLTVLSAGGFAADIRADLDRLADQLEPKVIEWRHDIHRNPELGNREFRTSGIVAASQIVLGLQTIVSRQINVTQEPAVITIGGIDGGNRFNIIPDKVEMVGTIRTFDEKMRDDIHKRVKLTVESIAAASGATATVSIEKPYDVTINDPALTERMLPTLQRVAGELNVKLRPKVTSSEDFSFFAQQSPGLFIFLGGSPKGTDMSKVAYNHSSRFFVEDSAMKLGVRALLNLTVDYMESSQAR